MHKHFYKKLLQQQFDFCGNHLTGYCETGNNEALHQFRVDVKKIRALMSFGNYCDKNFRNKELLQRLTSVYRKSSFIRNNHILIQQLENIKSEKLKRILDEVKLKTQLLEQRFIKNEQYNLLCVNKTGAVSVKAFPKASAKDGMKFISQRKRKIKSLLKNKPAQNALHGIRKKLKQLLYVMRFSANRFIVSETEIDIIVALQDKIGNWHDLKMLTSFLKRKKLYSKIPKSERLKIESDNRELLNEIYGLLNNLKSIIS